jgi:putative endonuclease
VPVVTFLHAGRYWVYILASDHPTPYTGITNDLERRLFEHKEGLVAGFSRKYDVHRLVYFEETDSPFAAIASEKRIKGWSRRKKIALIDSKNADWRDLSEGSRTPSRDYAPAPS